MLKSIFYFLYFMAAGILSYFLPENTRFVFGFASSMFSVWAWKVITDKVGRSVVTDFIWLVREMRQAQQAFDVLPSGTHLIKKLEREKSVDKELQDFVTATNKERRGVTCLK